MRVQVLIGVLNIAAQSWAAVQYGFVTYGQAAIIYLGVWCCVVNALVWARYPKAAIWYLKEGFLIVPVLWFFSNLCVCNCKIQRGDFCSANHDKLYPCYPRDEVSYSVTRDQYCPIYCANLVLMIVYVFLTHSKQYNHIQALYMLVILALGFYTAGAQLILGGWVALGWLCIFAATCMIIAAYVIYNRRLAAIRRANMIIANDASLYDDIWDSVMREMAVAIAHLDDVWSKLRERSPSRLTETPEQGDDSLKMLFRHARVVNVWYQRKVAFWRGKLQAKFPPKGTAEPHDPVPIKNPTRSIEKIRRSYFGVVSRASDIVRASIICNTMDEIAYLVELICDDPDVDCIGDDDDVLGRCRCACC